MTATQLEHSRMKGGTVSVNPFLLFLMLLVAPYVLFLGLLVVVTGELDLFLLAETVWQGEWNAFAKTWIIGSFVLALLGALTFGGYRTERYLLRRRSAHTVAPRLARHNSHYVIEDEPEPEDETRYADLGDAMESPKQ
jgi:hypothetical protein